MADLDFKKRAKELVSKMTLEEKITQMKYSAAAMERLGIPAYNWWSECNHGVARMGRATVFPQPIGMASSFNDKLLFDVATAISDEARANYNQFKKFGKTELYQGLTYWSPNINIFRDPRWGRGHETYGEDPYLTGSMATEFIKGLQGDGKHRKVDATIKHYVAHSGPESVRHGFDSKVSEKDLYETYLYAFKYCIENADPSAVMGAYNSVNGHLCCASDKMLKEILRGELGFKGYVVSDCGAIYDIHTHHKKTADAVESAALAVNSGCQINCGDMFDTLGEAVDRDLITEETITEAVELLYEARFRLGMFDDDCEYNSIPYEVLECEKHRQLNVKMAEESMILLKNNGILPLDPSLKVAIIGPNADSVPALLGNYNGIPSKYYTPLRGIQEFTDPIYAQGCHLFKENLMHDNCSNDEAIVAVNHADVVIMCMGLDATREGEGADDFNSGKAGDKRDLDLPASQITLYEKIKALGKPIIFVNITGSCINLSDQKENCAAIIQCFYPGAMGGLALANIIYGKACPSGRLPVTFYKSTEELGEFTDYSMENRTYKFYKGTPVYEFGYGLSYSEIKENWIDEKTVELENLGNYDCDYSVLRFEYTPHKNLKDFKKVFLKSGEKITVTFK